ncbi:MAG: fused response regulator/phosphatase [Rickettsiales bacterium]|nr:fused response regulator/phosphatase [Rickettsiales bacterium]
MNALKSSIKGGRQLSRSAKLLLVDDSKTARALIEANLQEIGVGQIVTAENGLDALKKLEDFSPELILLDLAMPVMDGLQFCEIFRNTESNIRNIPIIVMTGMEKSDERMRALRVGVSSILYKPVDINELKNRIEIHLQEKDLMEKMMRGETIAGEDVADAAHMLSILLPNQESLTQCRQAYRVDIDNAYKPCELFGGDYWAVYPLNEHVMGLFIADFSGHGALAAVHTFRLHKYLREYIRYYSSPSVVLEELNHAFVNMFPPGQYLTCALLFIDTHTHTITYSASAHPPFLLLHNGSVLQLDCSGLPLGVFAGAAYETRSVNYSNGDVIMLYSDALIEPNLQGKQVFTPQSLVALAEQAAVKSPSTTFSRIFSIVKEKKHHFDDDLTCIQLTL